MNKKGMIISGGTVETAFALNMLEEVKPAYIIGVDGGLSFLYHNQVAPTHIVGDFDSIEPEIIAYYKNNTDIPIHEFRPEKDASDTEIAVRLAVELGVESLWILGATGTRLDHVMANIQTLMIAHKKGIKAYIVDSHNRISLAEKEAVLSPETKFGTYFSVFPFGGTVEDISIEGAKYPLSHYRMCPNDSRGVSNEVEDQEVKITFPQGTILLMETRE